MNDIRKLLNIKYPIIQGGMAHIATAQLAASVSNAGGLGLIGCGGYDAQWLIEQVKLIKSLTDKPFGVNVMLKNPHTPSIMEALYELKVPVVTTGAGSPSAYINKLKEVGTLVIPVVPATFLAIRMEKLGADAVIVEGCEAGGHIGDLTTMTLVPQVAEAVSIPVIAAGGIASKQGVAAAYMLGASGVQVGTLFLATHECPIHDNFKELVINAKDTSTTVTGRQIGMPVRVLKNEMAKTYLQLAAQDCDPHELEKLTFGSLGKAVFDGDITNGSFMAGQIAGLIKEVKSVKEVISDLFDNVDDYIASIKVIK